MLTDEQRAMGRKAAAERRTYLATLTPEERASDACKAKAPELVQELLDAALGRDWATELDSKSRLQALTLALAYGIGRPVVGRPLRGGVPANTVEAAEARSLNVV